MLSPRRQLQIAVGLLLLTSPTTRAPRARRKQQPSTASTTVPPRQSRSESGAAASNPFVPLRDITEPELLSLLRIPDMVDQVGYVVSPHCEQLLRLRYDHACARCMLSGHPAPGTAPGAAADFAAMTRTARTLQPRRRAGWLGVHRFLWCVGAAIGPPCEPE